MATFALPVSGLDIKSSGTGTKPGFYTGGATVSAGAAVFADPDDLDTNNIGKVKTADVSSSATSADIDAIVGFAIQGTAANEGAVVAGNGVEVDGFVGLTAGEKYALDDTTGTLTDDPHTDLSAGSTIVWAGHATTTTALMVRVDNTGVTV